MKTVNFHVVYVPIKPLTERVPKKSGLRLIASSGNGRCNWWLIDIHLSDYTHRSHLVWMLPSNHKINNHLILTSSFVGGSPLITSSISCIISLWLFRVFPKRYSSQNEIWFNLSTIATLTGSFGLFWWTITVFIFFCQESQSLLKRTEKSNNTENDGSMEAIWKEILQRTCSSGFHFNDIVSVLVRYTIPIFYSWSQRILTEMLIQWCWPQK